MYSGSVSTLAQRNDSARTDQGSTWTAEQHQVARNLGNFLSPMIGQGSQRYEGKLTAGMSDQEKKGMSLLGSYTNASAPEQYGWASNSLNKAITGNYDNIVDPTATDALYGAIKEKALKIDLPEIQNSVAKNANLSGMYFSGDHSRQQAAAEGDVATRLAETLANLRYNDELQRRDIAMQREQRSFDAIPTALTVGQTIDQDPLNKSIAALTYGSLPRSLEQANIDADYNEFLRTLPENNNALALALQYLAQQGQYSNRTDTLENNRQLATKFSYGYGG